MIISSITRAWADVGAQIDRRTNGRLGWNVNVGPVLDLPPVKENSFRLSNRGLEIKVEDLLRAEDCSDINRPYRVYGAVLSLDTVLVRYRSSSSSYWYASQSLSLLLTLDYTRRGSSRSTSMSSIIPLLAPFPTSSTSTSTASCWWYSISFVLQKSVNSSAAAGARNMLLDYLY